MRPATQNGLETPHDAVAALTVLVTDGNGAARQVFADMVSQIGVCRVLTASTAEEALAHVGAGGVDLVLLDGATGAVDGVEITRQIRYGYTDFRRRTMTAVCLSTPTIGRICEARDAGANMVILKPISMRGLTTKLIQLATSPRTFIDVPGYAGPDRRVGLVAHYTGRLRRKSDQRRPKVVLDL